MGSEYETLNFHTDFCWPTSDKAVMAVFQRGKGCIFLV